MCAMVRRQPHSFPIADIQPSDALLLQSTAAEFADADFGSHSKTVVRKTVPLVPLAHAIPLPMDSMPRRSAVVYEFCRSH